uniref:Velvet domain-containing protein n=1 Tax=Haemonchus contortus TaxID=6289 RepID=A0A7I4YGU2_HAECO
MGSYSSSQWLPTLYVFIANIDIFLKIRGWVLINCIDGKLKAPTDGFYEIPLASSGAHLTIQVWVSSGSIARPHRLDGS